MKKHFSRWFGAYIAALTFVFCISICSTNINKNCILNNYIQNKALSGNETAINILREYKYPAILPEEVVREAINGNPNAIRILKLEDKNE